METRDAPKLRRVRRLDSIRLDKNDSTYFTNEGYLVDHPILTSCGIFEYTNPDGSIRRELRLPKYVFDENSLKTYRGKPIIITHDAGVLSAISSFFSNIFSGIASFVSSTFSNMVSGVTGFVGNIKNAIVNGLTAAIDWIKGLPSQALKWGSDIIDGIVSGIKGAIGKVTDAVKGVADKIKSFLHFSVPDEGPLTDYQSWMPDFMGGLADGISASEDTVLDKVKGVASGIKTLMQGATASAATAASSQVNNTTSNMTQNVNINNSYSGGSTETQKNVSKAMNKSAVDATTQMARGLAYARG